MVAAELVAEIVGIAVWARSGEDLLDQGQKVMERADGRERGEAWIAETAAGGSWAFEEGDIGVLVDDKVDLPKRVAS